MSVCVRALRNSTVLAFFIVLASCGPKSSLSVVEGHYQLQSAHLNQNGRYRDVECQGVFEIALSRSGSLLRIQPSGSSVCLAPNPASYREELGGDCKLEQLIFAESGQGETFKQSNLTLSCTQKGGVLSTFTVQVLSEKNLQLSHSTAGVETSSEFIFVRVKP